MPFKKERVWSIESFIEGPRGFTQILFVEVVGGFLLFVDRDFDHVGKWGVEVEVLVQSLLIRMNESQDFKNIAAFVDVHKFIGSVDYSLILQFTWWTDVHFVD